MADILIITLELIPNTFFCLAPVNLPLWSPVRLDVSRDMCRFWFQLLRWEVAFMFVILSERVGTTGNLIHFLGDRIAWISESKNHRVQNSTMLEK